VLYRSDRLNGLTDADVAHLARLGLRTICDFRNDREVGEDVTRVPDGATVIRFTVGSSRGDNAPTLEELIRAGEITSVSTETMAQGYLAMLEGSPEVFGGLVTHVAHADHHPVVFHCTAGKDRTGLGAALLLGAVGVADDVIVEDYRLTDDFRSVHRLAEIAPQLEEQGLALDDLKVLFTSPAETMELTLAAVGERWGGIEGYLTGPAGVSEQTLDDLRAVLVE
jgi:protein-tyrosine phosphatase